MAHNKTRGFTIVELLVVISIIALLVGILVPAVNKARDTARTTQSKSNLHQVTVAMTNYQSDWNGDHFTSAPHDLSAGSRTGTTCSSAISQWTSENNYNVDPNYAQYPGIRLGQMGSSIAFLNSVDGVAPYAFTSGNTSSNKPGYGTWRHPNALQCAEYMDSKPLHKAYFAPKDTAVVSALEACFELPDSYCPPTGAPPHWGTTPLWTSNLIMAPSSYVISPGMMYNATVYAYDEDANITFTDPMDTPRGFQPSTLDQARHPNLKGWLMEHSWLQNRPGNECSNQMDDTWFMSGDGCFDGCEPYHFNHSYKSAPVTSFADGHVAVIEIQKAQQADRKIAGQLGTDSGLWHRDSGDGGNGYYAGNSQDWTVWSGFTHDIDGVKGRTMLGDG